MHEQWAEKFWQRVRKGAPDACWEWVGSRLPKGYGRFYPKLRIGLYAHRVSWEIANGREVPSGLVVMHSCDNPKCVNPAHLGVGTHGDNARDCFAKGRGIQPSLQGESHPQAKLTEEQVISIRRRVAGGESRGSMAREFGVAKCTVRLIVNHRSWSWLEDGVDAA